MELRFSPDTTGRRIHLGEIQVRTFSPTLGQFETDSDSQFTLAADLLLSQEWQLIDTVNGVPSGTNASVAWSGRSPLTEYEWYATVDDSSKSATTLRFIKAPKAGDDSPARGADRPRQRVIAGLQLLGGSSSGGSRSRGRLSRSSMPRTWLQVPVESFIS